jgi:ribosomal-protein-alanine N-acetyltransferase
MSVVQTTRLLLRSFEELDIDALYEIQRDARYMRFTFWAQSREACAAWLRLYEDSREANGFAPWTVVHRSEERVIGWGGLNVDPHSPGWGIEVAYFIHPSYAGRGYATEVVRASLRHGFGDLALPRIGAFARPENRASARVLEKCGFRLLGYEPSLERDRYEARREDWDPTLTPPACESSHGRCA